MYVCIYNSSKQKSQNEKNVLSPCLLFLHGFVYLIPHVLKDGCWF